MLVRLGDPPVVPCFRCAFLLDMPPSRTAGSPLAACTQFLRQRRWPSPGSQRLGTPKFPIIRFRWDEPFAASLVRFLLQPVELLAPLGGSDQVFLLAVRGFYSRAFDVSVTLPVVGYNYGDN